MSEHTIAAHREGDLVAIETLVRDADYKGVANTSYLDAEAAIRFGEAVAAWGRQIISKGQPVTKNLPLATTYSLYPEDETTVKQP